MESMYLLFLAVFIIILVFPLTFDLKLSYNLVNNCGALSVRLWFIWIKIARIKRRGKDIILIEKHKNKEIEVEVAEPQLRFLQFFSQEVNNKTKIRNLSIYSKFGISDPFKSALFSSTLSNGILIILARLKSQQPTASIQLTNYSEFYETSFVVAILSRLALSIFDILYSFIISILRTYSDRVIEQKLKR